MSKIFRTKKADIPIVILVIGVIALCSLTLLNLFVSESRVVGSFYGVSLMHGLSLDIDKYNFYKNLGLSDEEINSKMNILVDTEGQRYFYAEEKKTFVELGLGTDWTKEKIVFSVKYILPD
jgi:hypothetical protein